MPQTLKKQALTLTIANGFTRGLGFFFRLMTARLMGAEAIGVMELSASAAMLALTPATAGLPTAMSRMTARPNADQSAVLRAGLSLNRRIALVMMPLLFLLAPGMAWLLSDFRTLPAILISIPAVFFAGLLRRVQRVVLRPRRYAHARAVRMQRANCAIRRKPYAAADFHAVAAVHPCRAAGFCRNSGGYLRLDDVPPPCAAAAGCAIRRFAP